mgnify:CR=1 FL=1
MRVNFLGSSKLTYEDKQVDCDSLESIYLYGVRYLEVDYEYAKCSLISNKVELFVTLKDVMPIAEVEIEDLF